MKIKKSIINTAFLAALFVVVAGSEVRAQYDAMFTQYMNNEMFINPAYTGSKDALSITALHRQQWVGVEGRPITTTLTAHSPIWLDKMGLGVSVLNEKIGVTNRNMVYLSYAYRVKTGQKGYLSFGLSGGIHVQTDRLSEIATDQWDDPHFSANTKSVVTPNFGFGINYNTDKFFAGISIPRLIDDHLTISTNGDVLKDIGITPKSFHYYLTVGRVFTISDYFKLKPSMMVKAVINAPLEFDINLSAFIREHLWIGVSYRTMSDISGLVGLQVSPRFLIGYSYDYPLSSINKHTGGSHEIVLSTLFAYKGKKVVSTRYF